MSSKFVVKHGDCLEALKELPDDSIDAIVTDPPYGLSSGNTEGFADRLGRILLDVVLPDLYDANVALGRLRKFPGPLDCVSFLHFMNRAVGEEPRIAVPESSIYFKGDSPAEQEIKDAREGSVLRADKGLSDVGYSEGIEDCGDFILQPRANRDTPFRDSFRRLFRQKGAGCFAVPVVILGDSGFSRFLSSFDPICAPFVADLVGLLNDSGVKPGTAPEIVAFSGTKVCAMLSFDLRRGTIELIPADTASHGDIVFQISCAEPVRASTGASCLSAKFEPCAFRFIGDVTNRTITFHFHKSLLNELNYTKKGFMGKEWDSEVPSVEVWAECLRVLKPGGHLLAFAGTRTQHRMAVRIEDAGFEIRDMLCWVYGSGFPKSINISKALDKMAGAEREVVGTKLGIPGYSAKTAEEGICYGNGLSNGESKCVITAPATDEAKQWDGWGSALKPALEPITLARKPFKGTIAENVLKHGTGGLNVDGCRVGDEVLPAQMAGTAKLGTFERENMLTPERIGRFPANFIHDGSEEVEALFPQGQSRFFYCAKASKADRDEGLDGGEGRANNHPTVKPTDLMQYLCRLITPPGGIVLDPFTGSGSTGKAAMLEGFRFIGIEKDTKYVEIARARIKAVKPKEKE